MKFGDNLRSLRKRRNMSQEDLASKINVSRQSVSKWETGDAYPEMNNILELCKIFHCHINDLVNDNIIDIDSLDEEIKMSIVKLKKEQQNKMKFLSKSIAILAKVCRVIVMFSIPIVIASMIILGTFYNKVEIRDNEIIINSNDVISIMEKDDRVILKVKDEVIVDTINNYNTPKINELFNNNSKLIVFGYIEAGFLFLLISLIIVIIILRYLEKLFNNINKGDTPFTLENVSFVKRMAYLMIVLTILPSFVGVIFEIILKMDLDVGFEWVSLIEILFLFSIAYIFQYGYEIQLDSKGKMYGEINE